MNEIITLLTGPGGLLVALLTIIYTGVRKMWVFGWTYKECVEEKKEWKNAALKTLNTAERAVDIREKNGK